MSDAETDGVDDSTSSLFPVGCDCCFARQAVSIIPNVNGIVCKTTHPGIDVAGRQGSISRFYLCLRTSDLQFPWALVLPEQQQRNR